MRKKKSFKDNPALQFVSTGPSPEEKEDIVVVSKSQEQKRRQGEEEANVPMKPNPLYIETKSKRVQLLMQPSLHRSLKKIAVSKGVSVNELVHSVLEAFVEKEK